MRLVSTALTLVLVATACSGDPNDDDTMMNSGDMTNGMAGSGGSEGNGLTPAPSWAELPPIVNPDPELEALPHREAQYERLCATPRGDSFFKTLCGGFRPNIPDFQGLLALMGLNEDRAFALTGNSTSLVSRAVSAINPRILVFPRVEGELEPLDEMQAVGFVRGEQFVEVVSRDLETGEPNFYLVRFEQACNYDGSCDLTSMLTEEIEHNWTAYSVYSEKDLENTSFDCITCHVPDGFGTPKILRMQELTSPWLHWFPQRFVQRTDSDRVLTEQFLSAHDVDAQYGGIPITTIANALDDGSGAHLEAFIRSEGYGEQPNVFDSRIEAEAKEQETSPTWQAQFEIALSAAAIPVPYPKADITDETKRLAAVRAYRDIVTGAAPRDTMPDIRDVFSQDAMEKLFFLPQPDADGRAVITQMCGRCHDGRSNPELTRSRFNAMALEEMSRTEKDLAITRLQEAAESGKKMPPPRSGTLTDAALAAAIAELQK